MACGGEQENALDQSISMQIHGQNVGVADGVRGEESGSRQVEERADQTTEPAQVTMRKYQFLLWPQGQCPTGGSIISILLRLELS